MPSTIIEVDTFTANVQTPLAGESASAPGLLSLALQPLTNRTRNLQTRLASLESSAVSILTRIGRLEAAASFIVTGSAVATGSPFTLTLEHDPHGLFQVIGGAAAQCPVPGYYDVSFTGGLTGSDATDGLFLQVELQRTPSTVFLNPFASRFHANTAIPVGIAGRGLVQITSETTERIRVLASTGGGTASIAGLSRLVVRRVY